MKFKGLTKKENKELIKLGKKKLGQITEKQFARYNELYKKVFAALELNQNETK